jgi:hypothetical protein
MATNDIGNGTNIEIVRLMPIDIPIHISWLMRNCLLPLLLLLLIVYPPYTRS